MANHRGERYYAIQRGDKYYSTGRPCKNGHTCERESLTGHCLMCKLDIARRWGEAHPDRLVKMRTENYYKNQEKRKAQKREYNARPEVKERTRKYRIENKEKEIARRKEYYAKNKKELNEKARIDQGNRRKVDELFALKQRCRNLINDSFRKYAHTKKNTKTEKILGCTFEEFKLHLEKQFTDGMSWDNRGEWHIDHIYPISLAKNEEEVYKLNHYTNLQPLWASDNIRKSNKVEQAVMI